MNLTNQELLKELAVRIESNQITFQFKDEKEFNEVCGTTYFRVLHLQAEDYDLPLTRI